MPPFCSNVEMEWVGRLRVGYGENNERKEVEQHKWLL